MRNAWNVDAAGVKGDVICARMTQALGVFMLQASFEAAGNRSRRLRVNKVDVSTTCLRFGISRRKYYDILEADIDERGNLVKGLIKLRDIDCLAQMLGLKTSLMIKAAEDAAGIVDMVKIVCAGAGRNLPYFLEDLEHDRLDIVEAAQ